MNEDRCLAEWNRQFTYEGIFIVKTFKSALAYCFLTTGHSGKHKAYLVGNPRNALIEW